MTGGSIRRDLVFVLSVLLLRLKAAFEEDFRKGDFSAGQEEDVAAFEVGSWKLTRSSLEVFFFVSGFSVKRNPEVV